MKRTIAIVAALVLGALSPTATLAQGRGDSLGAGWREQQNEARQGVQQGRLVPLPQVIQSIARRVPGRLLDAGLESAGGGRTVYRVRWATDDGRRIDFIVDAQSGQILAGG